MVLADKDIRYQLRHNRIVIDPLWDCGLQIQPCSVDLRLGTEFKVFPKPDVNYEGIEAMIDPLEDNPADLMKTFSLEEGMSFVLDPGDFALACTVERIKIPDDILGRVDGRSSIGRLGILIHATAGLIDPGFEGYLTLELANIGPYPVILTPGMRICQISFEMLSQKCSQPYGSRKGSKYQDQIGATASRIYQDTDSRK
jgi:dCTP deaminase